MFEGLSNLGAMLKQAKQMGARMKEMNEKLKNQRATGTAGGGLVEAEVNGLSEVLRITIDPSLIEKQDRELIEDLVPAAINAANSKARDMSGEMMKDVAGGLDLSSLGDVMGSLTGAAGGIDNLDFGDGDVDDGDDDDGDVDDGDVDDGDVDDGDVDDSDSDQFPKTV